MVERIRCYKKLNNQIFGILNKHLANSDVLSKPIREYQPPIYHWFSVSLTIGILWGFKLPTVHHIATL